MLRHTILSAVAFGRAGVTRKTALEDFFGPILEKIESATACMSLFSVVAVHGARF